MEQIIKILKGLHPEVDFTTADGLIDKRILDSFDIVTLVGELADEFDVEIGAEHMVPENFNSAQKILELIEKLEEE